MCLRMRGYSYDSQSVKFWEVLVHELLADGPRNEITAWLDSSGRILDHFFFRNVAFKGYLDSTKYIWNFSLWSFLQISQENEDGVRRSIGKELQVVRGVLVVARDEETVHLFEEPL